MNPLFSSLFEQQSDSPDAGLFLILTSAPETASTSLAHRLIAEKLAACVSKLPKVQSIYYWEGKVVKDEEVLMYIKTSSSSLSKCLDRLYELHPYDVPEILVFRPDIASSSYVSWVHDVTQQEET